MHEIFEIEKDNQSEDTNSDHDRAYDFYIDDRNFDDDDDEEEEEDERELCLVPFNSCDVAYHLYHCLHCTLSRFHLPISLFSIVSLTLLFFS
jgi:hypothetical protein